MNRKQWVVEHDPANKYRRTLKLGDRSVQLPADAIVSVTRGEGFNLWRMIVNAVSNQFVMRQMVKAPGLLFAELTGDGKQGMGQTLTVRESIAMVPFRDRGAHYFAKRFLSWFFGGKVPTYFLTWSAKGRIPPIEEATLLTKT